jgi:hypothetical protein
MRRALADVASEIQKAGEAQTLVSKAIGEAAPPKIVGPTTPSPPRSSESPPAVRTLPANQFLLRDSSPQLAVTAPMSVTATRVSNRAGVIAVVVVISLLLIPAIGIIVFLVIPRGSSNSGLTDSNSAQTNSNTNSSSAYQPPLIVHPSPSPALSLSTPTPTPSPANGSITGTVTDSNGAVIPGTSVTATRVADGKSFGKSTNGNGRYAFANLPVGIYTVRFQAPGFNTTIYTNVSVGEAAARVSPTLEVGSMTVMIRHR